MNKKIYWFVICSLAFVLVFLMFRDINFSLSFQEFFSSGASSILAIISLILSIYIYISERNKHK